MNDGYGYSVFKRYALGRPSYEVVWRGVCKGEFRTMAEAQKYINSELSK